MRRFLLPLTLMSLSFACGRDSTGDADTDASDEFVEHLLECDAPQPCDPLSYQQYAPPNPESIPSTSELQCAIDAVDAREPALLVVSTGCEGACSGALYLIRSDGTALQQWWTMGGGSVAVPGFEGSTVEDWASTGQICDLVEPGTCTPATCDHPSDWFLNCRDQDTNSCVP